MLHIDGSQGEGGGQMVRTALALSTLTGQPFRMTRIRANRPQAGLKAQHLRAIEALSAICGARVSKVARGAESLTYEPGPVQPGGYFFDIGTAGSISLLLQALLPPLLFASGPTTLRLRGGTCGKWQPPVEYTDKVLLPYLRRFAGIEMEIIRRGYFPKGGGEVNVRIHPKFSSWKEAAGLPAFSLLERKSLQRIAGIAFAAEILAQRQVAERMAAAAAAELQEWQCPVNITSVYGPAHNPGAGITLWAEVQASPSGSPLCLGTDALGERGKPAEAVGREAARRLHHALHSGGPVDEHLADQLVPYLALLPGSRLKMGHPSSHLLTNIDITELFLPVRFERKETIFEVRANK
ncbi:MAG: RNA 3'-terminal phosphate cyclase [Lewinellaceae bacterium]|nr:RNA 3'-terminal phosphate cyclase [Lewinellaceae bacterium]